MIEVNIEDIIRRVTPVRMRSVPLLELFKAYSKPNQTVLERFYLYYAKKRYEMAFNGQTMYLEHILNDKFDNELRRIHIANTELDNLVIYNASEDEEPLYIYNNSEQAEPTYLFSSEETSYMFIIYVPIGEIDDFDRFRSWVNRYKLQSKKYIIIEE